MCAVARSHPSAYIIHLYISITLRIYHTFIHIYYPPQTAQPSSVAWSLASPRAPQALWALSKLRAALAPAQLEGLQAASAHCLPGAPPVLLATMLWALADLQVVIDGGDVLSEGIHYVMSRLLMLDIQTLKSALCHWALADVQVPVVVGRRLRGRVVP
jgi:hypothetical protein